MADGEYRATDRLPSDLAGARHLYEQAAAAGDTAAMIQLGNLVADRLDPPDLDYARHMYERAAAADNTDAMVKLGNLLADRLDPPDVQRALQWYERAAAAGDTDGMVKLGNLLADRLDPPDVQRALQWYERAAAAGDTDGMVKLGNLLADRLDPPDLDAARHIYEQAAVAGNTDAMVKLGNLLADRLDPLDLDYARRMYEQAAVAGNTDAMIKLGNLLADRLKPPDLDAARLWYSLAGHAGPSDWVYSTVTLVDPSGQPSTAPTDSVPPWPLAGGITGDFVDPNRGIPLSDDHLGVAPYVSMLGSVITDVQTPMPLSVGLFGEWGSGKSYFMGLLRQKIADLSHSGEETYHREVIQIGFNAWHYADTNLWASLGDQIFRALFGTGEHLEKRQARLRAELGDLVGQRKELQADSELAQQDATRLRIALDLASGQREASTKELLKAVMKSPELGKSAKKAWRRLGVPDPADQGRLLATELNGALTAGTAICSSLAGHRGLMVVIPAIALTILTIALLVPLTTVDWLLRGGAATVTASLTWAVVLVARARSGLELLRRVAGQLRTDVDSAVDERMQKELAKLVAAVRSAEAKEADAQAQLTQVVSRVATLEQELAELSPGRRLYSFLTERAESDDYSRNLGIISTIRKDFEELVQLMADWKSRKGDEETPRPIDRIVLYIDDLDRCSPRQVVDVLQAVHLLLALDLFVVVVGVDPRWLLRSLQREYPLLLSNAESSDQNDPWSVNPEDYLKKIFNIPLVLPGMNSGSFGRIINGALRKGNAQPGTLPSSEPSDEDITVPLLPPVDIGDPKGTLGPPLPSADNLVEPGSEIANQASPGENAPPRPLTNPEISLLTALEDLIPTPREATRSLNLYRMVRSTRDLAEESRFLGDDTNPGEYQAVIVLLGLLTAPAKLLGQALDTPPQPNQDILGGLMYRPKSDVWPTFVRGMRPVRKDTKWTNDVVGSIPNADVPGWHVLASGLMRASAQVALRDLSAFHLWAPRIRRFSFVLPPVAMPTDAPEAVGAEDQK